MNEVERSMAEARAAAAAQAERNRDRETATLRIWNACECGYRWAGKVDVERFAGGPWMKRHRLMRDTQEWREGDEIPGTCRACKAESRSRYYAKQADVFAVKAAELRKSQMRTFNKRLKRVR